MMKKLIFVVLILVVLSPSATIGTHYGGTDLHFSDNLKVGDIFYWKMVTHRFEGEEVIEFKYREGSKFKVVIDGNLDEDLTNLNLFIDGDEADYLLPTTGEWPYLPTKVDFIILILYTTWVYENETTSNYFEQLVEVESNAPLVERVNYRNASIVDGEYIFMQSVRSINFDFRTYVQHDRYDFETGVINYHSHMEIDDDGTIFREVLFEKITESEFSQNDTAIDFPSTFLISLNLVLMVVISKKKNFNLL